MEPDAGVPQVSILRPGKPQTYAFSATAPPRTTALPPAFSIFSAADLENLWAWMVMAEVSSPEPRILISAFLLGGQAQLPVVVQSNLGDG